MVQLVDRRIDIANKTLRQSFLSSLIAACPRRTELEYLEGHSYRKSLALTIGSLFHESYLSYWKSCMDDRRMRLTDVLDIFSELYRAVDWRQVSSSNDPSRSPFANTEERKMDGGRAYTNTISLIRSYYETAEKVAASNIRGAEVYGEVVVDGWRITSHIDVLVGTQLKPKIVELKTARVQQRTNRNGTYEVFPDYGDAVNARKPQPYIHALIFGVGTYELHVVGKGSSDLVRIYQVQQKKEQVEAWRERVLRPALRQVEEGIFPAVMSPLCGTCQFAKDKEKCGVGL